MSSLQTTSIYPDLSQYNQNIIEENPPSAPPMDDEVKADTDQAFLANLPSAPPMDDDEIADQASAQYQIFCTNPYAPIQEELLIVPPLEEIKLSEEDLNVASSMQATVMDQFIHKIKGNRQFQREFCKLVLDYSKIQEMEIQLEHLEKTLKPEAQAVFNVLKNMDIDVLRRELQFPFSEVDTADIALTIFVKKILLEKIKALTNILKGVSPEFLEKCIIRNTAIREEDKKIEFSREELDRFNEVKEFALMDSIKEIEQDTDFYHKFCKLLPDAEQINSEEDNISSSFEKELTIEEQVVFNILSECIFQKAKEMLKSSPFEFKNTNDTILMMATNELIKEMDNFADFFRHNCPEYLQKLLIDQTIPFLIEAEQIQLPMEAQREVVAYQSTFVEDISSKLTKKFPHLLDEVAQMALEPETISKKESDFKDIESSLDPEFLSTFLFLTKGAFDSIQKTWGQYLIRDEDGEKALMLLIKEIAIEELEVYVHTLRESYPEYLNKAALHHKGQIFKEAYDQIKEEVATKKMTEESFIRQKAAEEKVAEKGFTIPGLATLRSIYQYFYQRLFGKE